jgi:hypothetical protein
MAAAQTPDVHPDVATVMGMMHAWGAGDFTKDFDAAFDKHIHAEVTSSYHPVAPHASMPQHFVGKIGLKRWIATLYKMEITLFVPRLAAFGDGSVAVHLTRQGHIKATGTAFAKGTVMMLYTLKDGKILSVETYGETPEGFAALASEA